jgi:hypothetical protein
LIHEQSATKSCMVANTYQIYACSTNDVIHTDTIVTVCYKDKIYWGMKVPCFCHKSSSHLFWWEMVALTVNFAGMQSWPISETLWSTDAIIHSIKCLYEDLRLISMLEWRPDMPTLYIKQEITSLVSREIKACSYYYMQ